MSQHLLIYRLSKNRRGLSHDNEELEEGYRFKRLTDSDIVCCSTDTQSTTQTQNNMVFKNGFAKLDQVNFNSFLSYEQ